MLTLVLKPKEQFSEKTMKLTEIPMAEVKLEHSLLSISKWEAKWEVPFLTDTDRTPEQMMDYIFCMAIDPKYLNALRYVDNEEVSAISAYINSKQTASTVKPPKSGNGPNQVITSELIYSWMAQYRIPYACEKWHLNRLLIHIAIMGALNDTDGKKNKKNAAQRSMNFATENARRLAQSGLPG